MHEKEVVMRVMHTPCMHARARTSPAAGIYACFLDLDIETDQTNRSRAAPSTYDIGAVVRASVECRRTYRPTNKQYSTDLIHVLILF
jgi:hypothetical protein